MIKKPTLFLLVCAIALAAGVYYFDYKRSLNPKPPEDAPKSAFTFQASDVKSLTLSHPSRPGEAPIQFESHDGTWLIAQPLKTEADQSAVQGIITSIADAKVAQSEPGTPDRLKAFGLDTPETSIEFQLQNGSKHSIQLGSKDFSGSSAYSIIDSGKTVSLLPESLLGAANKSLDELRDHSVLHISAGNVASFTLKNHSGEIAAAKDKNDWTFSKPASTLADSDAVTTLFTAISSAKATAIVSETSSDLAKYGLTAPAITFTAIDGKGDLSTLKVGKKDGSDYFALDVSRPLIFRINQDTFNKLAETYADLRDKKLAHFDPTAIDHVEIRGSNGAIDLTRKSAEEWTFDAPADQKGKSAGIWKLFSPLSEAKADDVLDHPPADITSKIAKPALEIDLSGKNNVKLTVRFSKEVGDVVHAQSSASPAVYRFKKQTLTDLDLKPADLAF
jgi:hypothetical protein